MKKLVNPLQNVSIETIFKDCNKSYTISKEHFACNKYLPKIIEYTNMYKKHVPKDVSFLNQNDIFENKPNDKQLLIDYYKHKFVQVSKIRKKYYDVIIANANGTCPICGQITDLTIDHYLPKSKYPLLSLSPINLIPCCYSCNKDKGDWDPIPLEKAPIHIYLEEINEVWLGVDITFHNGEINYKFKAIHSDNTYNDRLNFSLEKYKMSSRFKGNCVFEINSSKNMYKKYVETDPSLTLLEKHFMEIIESCEYSDKNSWKSALYRGLLNNIEEFANWLQCHS